MVWWINTTKEHDIVGDHCSRWLSLIYFLVFQQKGRQPRIGYLKLRSAKKASDRRPVRCNSNILPLRRLSQPLKMHCKTCALVTSSGHLIGSQRGREIDSSECVIRMNDAPVTGHWRDVGRRTSLRVVAHSSLQRVLRNRQELLNASQDAAYIFWGPSSSMRRDGKGQVYNNLRLQSQLLPSLRVFVISRLKMLKFDELFKRETGIDR